MEGREMWPCAHGPAMSQLMLVAISTVLSHPHPSCPEPYPEAPSLSVRRSPFPESFLKHFQFINLATETICFLNISLSHLVHSCPAAST